MVAHLSVDDKGVRGDQPGFDKAHVKTYGFGAIAAKDFIGESTWSSFVATTGWTLGDKATWPTVFNYDDPRFVKTMDWVRSLTDKGFAPKIGTFTTSDVDQLSSGKVAMETGGSWEASTFAKIPGVKVGIAPTVLGPDGKRAVMSNSNGNNIWAGTKNPDLAWKWVSYMGSTACQTMASEKNGSFFPSIPAAMDAMSASLGKQGINLNVFTQYQKQNSLYSAAVYANGSALQSAEQPLLDEFYDGSAGNSIFQTMQSKSVSVLSGQN